MQTEAMTSKKQQNLLPTIHMQNLCHLLYFAAKAFHKFKLYYRGKYMSHILGKICWQ